MFLMIVKRNWFRLAICKAIIQAHGGKIWAKDEKDGACFIFTIPSDKELNV